MAGLGHQERFLPPKLSGRCRFRQRTFTGTRGNGYVAPVPALRAPRWNRRTRALGHLRLPGRMLADRARSACTQSHNTRRCHDEVAGYGPHVSVFAY
jgi:hypothetical protein